MALRDRKSFSTFGEVLVGADDSGGVQLVAGDGGAQHVDAVESRFGVDVFLVPGDRSAMVSVMSSWKCFAILWRPRTLPDAQPDLVGPDQSARACTAARIGASAVSVASSSSVAFAGPQVGQGGVPAGDQAFAGVVGVA